MSTLEGSVDVRELAVAAMRDSVTNGSTRDWADLCAVVRKAVGRDAFTQSLVGDAIKALGLIDTRRTDARGQPLPGVRYTLPQRASAVTTSSAAVAAPPPQKEPTMHAYSNTELRQRITAIFGCDASHGREQLALMLTTSAGVTTQSAISALRASAQDANGTPKYESSSELFARRRREQAQARGQALAPVSAASRAAEGQRAATAPESDTDIFARRRREAGHA